MRGWPPESTVDWSRCIGWDHYAILRVSPKLVILAAIFWALWRCVEPTKQMILGRFPKVPVEEIDKSFFRPVLLVVSILTFFQMLESRESLSLISVGDVFGETLTIGKLFTALVIV